MSRNRAVKHDYIPGLVLIGLISILVLISPPFGRVRRYWVSIVQPMAGWMYKLGVSSSPFRTELTNPSQEATQINAQLLMVKSENEILRRQLNLPQRPELKIIGADVIGRSGNPLSRNMRINRGKKDGIKLNNAVMYDGYVIGKIIGLEDGWSEVQLISDPDFRLTVTVGNSSVAGLATGSPGGLIVRRIPVTEPVQSDDLVSTSNVGNQAPPGLPIGTVRTVKSSDNVFHEITVETPVSLESLRLVMVVIQ